MIPFQRIARISGVWLQVKLRSISRNKVSGEREFGLPGALWLAAQRSGVWDVLKSMWPEPPCFLIFRFHW